MTIWLERAFSEEAINRAQIARRSEELKSTLLDAVAHEFKTPLTSIKAVTTDLLSDPSAPLEKHQRELISIADEGADRLSTLVTQAIQLARIEGGTFQLHRGMHFPSSLISSALRQMKSWTDGREIKVGIEKEPNPADIGSSSLAEHEISAQQVETELRQAQFEIVTLQDSFIDKDPENESWWLILARKP